MIASIFFLTLQLMTKEPPPWAFKCPTCQKNDGRFRVVTADGIWLGYLKRLASLRYVNPSEICSSVRETVNAASIHPSEWVRRFLRMTLKQPTMQVVIKSDQLNSAKRALSFLCPEQLQFMVETLLGSEQRLQLVRLRSLLSSLWDLDRAAVSLANAIDVHVKKRLAARNSLSEADVAAYHLTLRHLQLWLVHVEQGPNGGGAAGGVGVVVGVGGAGDAAGMRAGAAVIDGADGLQAAAAGGAAGAAALNGSGAAAGANGAGAQGAHAPGGGAGFAAPAGDAVHDDWLGGGGAVGARAVGGARAGGARGAVGGARGPAATALRHHMDRTTNEPLDPRCLRPHIKALGESVFRDILSFTISITIDPSVNVFQPRHCAAFSKLAAILRAANGRDIMQQLKWLVTVVPGAEPHPETAYVAPLANDAVANPPRANAAGLPVPNGDGLGPQPRVGVGDQTATADGQPLPGQPDPMDLAGVVDLLKESRLLFSSLVAISGTSRTFRSLAVPAAGALEAVRAAIEKYFTKSVGKDGTAAAYQQRWGDSRLTPEELRARFVGDYPLASDDASVTGSWFPGMLMCRPAAFTPAEEAELGTCAKKYEEAHKFFSPGTFTICCAYAHPKMLGFVVLDKLEGPLALLNALLSYFELLPLFVVYDFACGALRSSIGKLPFFVAMVVLLADLFHIVNHLCSDALHPLSYTPLDKVNTVAHEQRNAPISLLRRTLRAVGQQENMNVLKMENVVFNVMAQAKSTCPYELPETYNYRQYYFSRTPCCCGCDYHPDARPQPPPPPTVPAAPEPE